MYVIEFPFIFSLFHSMCFSRDISQQTIQLDSIRFSSIRFDGISYSFYIPDMLYILVCSEMRTVCYVCVCVCVCVCEEAEERGKSHLDHLNESEEHLSNSNPNPLLYATVCYACLPYCKASHYISFRNEFLVHDWKTFIIFHILEQGPL